MAGIQVPSRHDSVCVMQRSTLPDKHPDSAPIQYDDADQMQCTVHLIAVIQHIFHFATPRVSS